MNVPDGTYSARAVAAALGETKSGKEQVAVEFAIEGGAHITWYGYFTEKTVERTIESLRICGWSGLDLTDLSGIDANVVSIVVEEEEYEGKTHSRVKWINKPGGLAVQAPLSPEKARSFADRMKGNLLAYDQKAGAPPVKKGNGAAKAPSHTDKPPF